MRAVACLLALSAAGGAAAGEIAICVSGDYPPFASLNDQGELEGFDIDIARALCDEMKATCELRPTEWEAIIPALEEGKCDAIVASMSITEERKQRIDFSEKYYNSPIVFAAPDDAAWEDTNEGLAGKRVCIQSGTIHQDYLEEEFPDVDLALYQSQEEANLDLLSGRCDATMASAIVLEESLFSAEGGEDFAVRGRDHYDPDLHGEGAGVGVRKSDAELRDRISRAIEAIRADGTYRRINDRYFSFDIYGG